jgi:hypothetical protein
MSNHFPDYKEYHVSPLAFQIEITASLIVSDSSNTSEFLGKRFPKLLAIIANPGSPFEYK